MKILVIGSRGFIGSHCVDYFSRLHEVWGCDVIFDYNIPNYMVVLGESTVFGTTVRCHQRGASYAGHISKYNLDDCHLPYYICPQDELLCHSLSGGSD